MSFGKIKAGMSGKDLMPKRWESEMKGLGSQRFFSWSIREPHTNELQNRIANEPPTFMLSAERSTLGTSKRILLSAPPLGPDMNYQNKNKSEILINPSSQRLSYILTYLIPSIILLNSVALTVLHMDSMRLWEGK